ncbi:MAG: COG4315 family predicted lipoprotein [Methyloligella sp. ZOD6]
MRFGFLALFAAAFFVVLPAQAEDGKITVQESEVYDEYIADGEGKPLYLFVPDTQGTGETDAKATCYDDCAKAWPPFTGDSATAGEGADSELIGTVERKDGSSQITYNGWPLYYFVKDKTGEEPKGWDIHAFGGEWYLVTADGGKVHEHEHDEEHEEHHEHHDH